ncbi:MucR family transcriptional regulator [Polymorphobacter megasporae]|uniref:MucR family transcriptional regulator n=1 Tax=Glacieibacterium megasporae TaxID=2835787 RepID=UPI001C1E6416|nr:MucR family transcriptional regulator [Polymorphobacter megasporae]UAJ12686.1 MucR family transcriptional regulator [Polymorphobacter megasporae]
MKDDNNDTIRHTLALLSVYVEHNHVKPEELPSLITSTHAALRAATTSFPDKAADVDSEVYDAATSVRKSLASPDYILSMVNGKPYKSLGRHLASLGITPQEYRERYRLPSNYPMTAPTYSLERSNIAKRRGLGSRIKVRN